MTYDQFYRDHVWLTVSYIKAYKRKRELFHQDAYIMGAYVYEAISRNTPAMNPFSKTQAKPWLERPFDLTGRDQEPNISDGDVQGGERTAASFMAEFMASHNKLMAEKRMMDEKRKAAPSTQD